MRQSCQRIALAFFLAILAPQALAVESPDNPAAAIQLVLDTRQSEIRAVDNPGSWWHDTKERTWSVKRLVEPGILDATHTFIVTYSVDGVALASWRVDTSAGTAVPQVPAERDSANFGLTEPNPEAEIHSAVGADFTGWKSNTHIALENGQVWQVIDGSTGYVGPANRKVVVRPAALGSYRIKLEGLNKPPTVRRIK